MAADARAQLAELGSVRYAEPLLLPVRLTRYQKFLAFMRAPESALWPMGLWVLGAHVFVGAYLFSETFVEDFDGDDSVSDLVKGMVKVNKNTRMRFAAIKRNFSGSNE